MGEEQKEKLTDYLVWDTSSQNDGSLCSAIGPETAARIFASRNIDRPGARINGKAIEMSVGVARYDATETTRKYTVRLTLSSERS